MLLGELAHQLRGRPVGHSLGQLVPARFLLGTEVRTVKQLLQADDLCPALGRFGDQRDVLLDHRLLDRRRPARLLFRRASPESRHHGRFVA